MWSSQPPERRRTFRRAWSGGPPPAGPRVFRTAWHPYRQQAFAASVEVGVPVSMGASFTATSSGVAVLEAAAVLVVEGSPVGNRYEQAFTLGVDARVGAVDMAELFPATTLFPSEGRFPHAEGPSTGRGEFELSITVGMGAVGESQAGNYTAEFTLAVDIGMGTTTATGLFPSTGLFPDAATVFPAGVLGGRWFADATLDVPGVGVGASGVGRYGRDTQLAVTIGMGATGAAHEAAATGIGVTPAITAAGAERYIGGAELAVTPDVAATGTERYARAAELAVTVELGADGSEHHEVYAAAFTIDATGVAVAAVGGERYSRDATIGVSIGMAAAGEVLAAPMPALDRYPSTTFYPSEPITQQQSVVLAVDVGVGGAGQPHAFPADMSIGVTVGMSAVGAVPAARTTEIAVTVGVGAAGLGRNAPVETQFTSGTTWTVPTNCRYVDVILVGGGGGGGGGGTSNNGGQGKKGGVTAFTLERGVNLPATITFGLGSGGGGAGGSGSSGSSGGATTAAGQSASGGAGGGSQSGGTQNGETFGSTSYGGRTYTSDGSGGTGNGGAASGHANGGAGGNKQFFGNNKGGGGSPGVAWTYTY